MKQFRKCSYFIRFSAGFFPYGNLSLIEVACQWRDQAIDMLFSLKGNICVLGAFKRERISGEDFFNRYFKV
ncbi:hypothetical protein [Sunxiuqinia sp. sy24]|uniref:hypothetical protein n=1 Tax=Sunxiuqinia sp. sy24 TaxID=3461495 RepID=UPI0040464C28